MLRILITTAGKGKKWRFYPSRSCHKYGYITNSYTEFLSLLFYIFLMRASHRGEEIIASEFLRFKLLPNCFSLSCNLPFCHHHLDRRTTYSTYKGGKKLSNGTECPRSKDVISISCLTLLWYIYIYRPLSVFQ